MSRHRWSDPTDGWQAGCTALIVTCAGAFMVLYGALSIGAEQLEVWSGRYGGRATLTGSDVIAYSLIPLAAGSLLLIGAYALWRQSRQ